MYVDDVENKGVHGGKAYGSYDVSKEGAVVVVRPDGYIGTIVPLEGVQELDEYFAAFLKPKSS